jgi:glycerol kinase
MPQMILAIDQGTTNTKAVLVDETGHIQGRASRPLAVSYPQPAWVEQDPMELWHSTAEAVAECLGQHDVRPGAVAVTNQRESVVVWERATGRPVGPVVVWQCRRTAPFVSRLREQGHAATIHERTGLQLDPLFSASKARWLLDHTDRGFERAAAGELCVGTIDSWVLWHLTGGAVHACDATNASRTQLYNLETAAWDEALLDLFEVPRAALPEIHPSSAVYGHTACEVLPDGVPIASMIGDSHAALYGHAGFRPGSIKATYGTGSSLMTPLPEPKLSDRGLSTTVAWAGDEVTYAFEGNISVTGAAVQWLAELLGLSDGGAGVQRLAESVADANGVTFVPAFVGLGAPHWDADARGTITGLTRGAGAGHLARATLESIAFQIRDVFDLMQAEAGAPLTTLMADGGASKNDLLMQFQADILGCPVLRSTSSDVSALGAAYLAGLATGVWSSEDEAASLDRPHDRFEPQMPAAEREARYEGWKVAVARTRYEGTSNG